MRLLIIIIVLMIQQIAWASTQSIDSLRSKRPYQSMRTLTIMGQIFDEVNHETLPGVHILYGSPNTLKAVSDKNGKFKFETTDTVTPQLTISYIGHNYYSENLHAQIQKDSLIDLGKIYLSSVMLDEIVVTEKLPLSIQRGDTTQFNADAVKLAPDANLENLLKRLPGFEIIDGKLMAQGRVIEKLYIDGTTYFLNDPQAALKNLPANLVSKIKLFDDRSEEAKFSGYDDGSKFRSINIETKNPNKPKYFGEATAGYGIAQKIENTFKENNFLFNTNTSFFDKKRRLTLDANVENTDQANQLDGSRYPRLKGKNQKYDIGMNFSYNQPDKYSTTGMYRTHNIKNYSANLSQQDYFKTDQYDNRIYDSESHQWSDNQDHNLYLRMEYFINSKNRIFFTPNINIGKNNTESLNFAQNIENNDTINRSESFSRNDSKNNTYQGNLSWMHAFEKKGRTATLKGNYSYSNSKSAQYRVSKERNLNNENIYVDTLKNQLIKNDQDNFNWQLSLNYSEPLSEESRISFQYAHQELKSEINKSSHAYRDSSFNELIGVDTALTNTLINKRIIERIGVNFNIGNEKFSLNGGSGLNFTKMNNHYKFINHKKDSIVRNQYLDFTPRIDIRYTLNDNSSFNLNYYGNTLSPTATQLQDVLNVTNSLQISTGNPSLNKSYTHTLSLYWDNAMPEHSQFLNIGVTIGQTYNKIASNVRFLQRDTIIDDYVIQRGARFSSPVNLNGDWNLETYCSYSFPCDALKLRFNTSFNYGFQHTPNIYDNLRNFSNMHNGALSLNISTNISEDFDFMLTSRSAYSYTTNSSTGHSENFNQNINAYLNWTIWKGFFIGGDFTYQYFLNKKDDSVNQSNKILNSYIGKKFGKLRAAELRLTLNDLFHEQDRVNYELSDLYSSRSLSTQIVNYYMISFTYRFNSMQSKHKN